MKRFTFALSFLLSILMAMGSNVINPYHIYGDLDGDNKATINDVAVLINYLLSGKPAFPVAQHTPNMTIAEFKAKHWQDVSSYIDTVAENEIIHGWVTSSDESDNIYKTLYIVDESGAGLAISVNKSGLFVDYPIGQEIVLPMQGYYVGKYNSMQMIGYPYWYAQGNVWEVTFLPQAIWESLVELNGIPDSERAEVQPVDVSLNEFVDKTDSETLLQYQGKLIRIKNVTFSEADGVTTYAETSGSTNRTMMDENGNSLILRTSKYADFALNPMPEGKVDVVGLLSMYNNTWQLVLRSAEDVIVGGSTGTDSNPYTIEQAIQEQNTGTMGWIMGYAVGAVAPEVTSITSNADIEWKVPTTLDNTIVLADDPNCKDYTKCVIVPLPQGSAFRQQANLKDNEIVYKTRVKANGRLGSFMGAAGLLDNNGSTDEFELVDVIVVPLGITELDEGFDNSIPTDWANVKVSGDKAWYQTIFSNNGYAAMTGYMGMQPPFDAWLISPPLDIENAANKMMSFRTQVNAYGSTTSNLEVYLLNSNDPTAATVKVKLDPVLAAAPASGYSPWTKSGDIDLSQWADGVYYIGFRYIAPQDVNYATWCVDDVKFGIMGDVEVHRADLETMGAASATYGSYTSTDGWVADNCMLLSGGEVNANPVFVFIGFMPNSTTDYAVAPTLNGKVTAVGTLVSPVLHGGLTRLYFNYGAAFSDAVLSFRIDVKQDGQVVKTWTVTNDDVTKWEVYNFDEECSIAGDFTIEFTNLCPSGATTNKNRVSVWNINWDSAQ